MTDNTYLTSPVDSSIIIENVCPVKPPFAVKDNDKDILEWDEQISEAYKDSAQKRITTQVNNLLLYRGSYFDDQDKFGRSTVKGTISSQMSRVTIPELYEYTDNRVNRTVRNSTSFAVVPPTQEHSDKNGAKAVKAMLDSIEYKNRLQKVYREIVKDSIIFGEAWLLILWDDYKGDIHPDWIKASKSKATNYGKNKAKVKIGGKEFTFDPKSPIRIGDVIFRHPMPWEIDIDKRSCPEDVQWLRWRRWRHVEELKQEYPGKASEIQERAGKGTIFNVDTMQVETFDDMVLETQIWCRTTRYLDSGRYIKLIPDLVLEKTDNPYPPQEDSEWGNLPGERLTDIDVSNCPYGVSSYQHLAPLNHAVNQIFTMAKNSALVAGHPKILAPIQSGCKAESFQNDISIIWYRAPFAPTTISPSVVSPDLFGLINLFAQKLMQIEGRQSTSRGGELPPNVRSGKQMAMMEELEQMRADERGKKKDEFVVSVMRKVMAIIGLKYPEHQERMIHILGRDKMPLIKSFDASVLNKSYDVRIISASALATTPQERINQVRELFSSELRALYPDEQWAAMLDLGVPGKFFDAVTASADKASWENEEWTNGKKVPEPVIGDDDFVHWRTHILLVRSVAFMDFSEDIQNEVRDHIAVHEMSIFDQMTENPSVQQFILSNPLFPAFYTPPPQLPQEEMMPPPGAEAAMMAGGIGTPPPPPSQAPMMPPEMMMPPPATPQAPPIYLNVAGQEVPQNAQPINISMDMSDKSPREIRIVTDPVTGERVGRIVPVGG